jgi:hypothetical protein
MWLQSIKSNPYKALDQDFPDRISADCYARDNACANLPVSVSTTECVHSLSCYQWTTALPSCCSKGEC